MGWWLAKAEDQMVHDHIKRFDPLYWSVNFRAPMLASVVTTAADALRVDALFYKRNDLAGLIWENEDRHDHPLLRYETAGDMRRCQLTFRWRSSGIKPLDALNGPTLTIEGRDADGSPRSWYVRLWNYAQGTAEDAIISLDFGNLDGGFLLPGEADPVWAGDVDRLFISLVPPDYDGSDTALATPQAGWVELSEIDCSGSASVLRVGDVMVPPNGYSIATGYDDLYHLTPARVIHNAYRLGYRGPITHYVGMSHYFRLMAGSGGWLVDDAAADPIATPARAWHENMVAEAKRLGFEIIASLSYELLDQHCPDSWKQRAYDGTVGMTGWSPPSALLSPAKAEAMAYLAKVASGFAALLLDAGLPVRFQIGEPWWWVMPDGKPCLYDDAAKVALGGAPIEIADVKAAMTPAQTQLLDAAGALLAATTVALRDAVRAVAADAQVLLLAYLPSVLDGQAPELKRANLPLGWAAPVFDRLQLEAYDWVIAGRTAAHDAAMALATTRLGYLIAQQHYLSGFALTADSGPVWSRIADQAQARHAAGTEHVFLWALPQILRDGFTLFSLGESEMHAFDDVDFPIAIGAQAEVETGFSTAIVAMASGHEQRNADWANARLRFDAGPGVRSDADVAELIGFYRARLGPARGFRFRDPFDYRSGASEVPLPTDQLLGSGDGVTTDFPLRKTFGSGASAEVRRITRPVAGSVRVALDAVEASNWTLLPMGIVRFAQAPAAGAAVRAGFLFDVPVRFAEDRLTVSRATYLAGEIASVPLVELREG